MPTPQRSSSPSSVRDHDDVVEVIVRWGHDVVAAGSVGLGGSLHLLDGDVRVSVAADAVSVAGVVEARLSRAGGSAEGAGLQVEVSPRNPEAIVGDDVDIDVGFVRTMAVALVMQVGLITASFITPPALPPGDGALDWSRLAAGIEVPRRALPPPTSPKASPPKRAAQLAVAPPAPGAAPKTKTPKQRRDDNQKLAVEAMAAMGLGGARAVLTGHEMDGLVGTALAQLTGVGATDVGGVTGLGTRTMGAGVGGVAVDIGGIGSGTGRGVSNTGGVDLIGRGHSSSRIVPGPIHYAGGLDRAEIQRVVARHMSQIKYCYERELNKDPNLEGKLVLQWHIAGSGAVSSSSTLQNTFSGPAGRAVDACVSRIVRRMQFPSPRGGGVVDVSYPFSFARAGE